VGLKSKVPGEDGEVEEPHTGDIQVVLISKEKATSIRGLTVSMC
jgi:DNA replication licensing factor MCM5